ncbi:transposable element Tcb2 transposase [Trichonephila clavipes]|nr:transposable element Tcb2 transposase [Trichonephila clavipes]
MSDKHWFNLLPLGFGISKKMVLGWHHKLSSRWQEAINNEGYYIILQSFIKSDTALNWSDPYFSEFLLERSTDLNRMFLLLSRDPLGTGVEESDSQVLHAPSCTLVDCTTQSLRLAWTLQHRLWAIDDRKHVAWSHESHFQLNRADERVRVWRQPHESMYNTCQWATVQAGGGSVIV